jgi:XTP/dITP diphosphohydrolase
MNSTLESFQRLIEIVAELREKCPWDREQTKESLRHLTIEETYELADAILKDDYPEIKVELGDVLLHILFYSKIATEEEQFTLKEVIDSLIDKLIRRHPHVYGEMVLEDNAKDVLKNWEKIKEMENKGKKKSILSGVPDSMPSLIKALRMQEKAAGVGFDWKESGGAWLKVKEEMLEFEEAENHQDKEGEMGDLFFALINYCRLEGINPEDALARTNEKFKFRFQYMENVAIEREQALAQMTLDEMEELWVEAKKIK